MDWILSAPTGEVDNEPKSDSGSESPKSKTTPPLLASSALTPSLAEGVAENDLLNREGVIEALYRLLTERQDIKPFAIGLFGHWGSGKSSLIHLLQKRIKEIRPGVSKPEIKVATFNAWRNEKANNIAAMLAQSVVDALVSDLKPHQRMLLALKLAVRRQHRLIKSADGVWTFISQWFPVLAPFILVLLAPLIIWYGLGLWASEHQKLIAVPAFFSTLAIWFSSFQKLVRNNLTGWFKKIGVDDPMSVLRLPDYGAHRGLIEDIHRTLELLCQMTLTGEESPRRGDYLLLVIDDLDRCTVSSVKEVFDAVRLVGDISRVVTLVAIDERMAFAAVEQHYAQFGDAGRSPALVARDYLAKVIQVSVTLQQVDGKDLDYFVDQKLFQVQEVKSLASDKGGTAAEAGVEVSGTVAASVGATSSTAPDSVGASDVIEKAKASITSRLTKPFRELFGMEAAKAPAEAPLADTLPDERELFKELARSFRFRNPRLLWRMYLAWKLYKSLALDEVYELKDVELSLHLLFWCEWVLQRELGERKIFDDWLLKEPESDDALAKHPMIRDRMEPIRSGNDKAELRGIQVNLKAVLLPASKSEGDEAAPIASYSRSPKRSNPLVDGEEGKVSGKRRTKKTNASTAVSEKVSK